MFFLLLLSASILIILTAYIINNSYVYAVKKSRESILQSLHEYAILVNSDKKINFINAAAEKLLGISLKSSAKQPIDSILKLYSEEDGTPIAFTTYADTAGNSTNSKRTLILRNINSEKKQVFITVTKGALGPRDSSLIILTDTSGEKQLEEMKVDFVSMAAHELRTPLTAIRGYASLLQMHYATNLDASAKELLTRLIVSTTTLTNLIDNLLSVSRIESNNLTVEVKPLDLSVIITDIFSSFEDQAHTKKQRFSLNVPKKLRAVMADPFRIGQVFINLISNALNYTPEGGIITVTITDKTDHLEITVQDTGEGIPKEAMPRLFTKFFRVSGSLEQGSKGTGLGLYITKSIIEMHKGKIWAESTPGKGSIFTVTLPVASEEQKTQQEQQNANNAFLTVKNGQGIIIRKMQTSLSQNQKTL